VLLFNNGLGRTGQRFSTVDEIELPLLPGGSYTRPAAGEAFLPERPVWSYEADGFYSPNISGAQRLPNGDTLICEGASGHVFEVTSAGEIVWDFTNPFSASGPRGPRNEVFKVRRYAPDDPAILQILAAP
jgi:hypothetical protein